MEEWFSGGVVQWRSGSVEEWFSGGVVQWRSGSVEDLTLRHEMLCLPAKMG